MSTAIKKARILFIDDEISTVKQYMAHLKKEGFTNIVHKKDIAAFSEVLDIQADIIFLDITGVAASLDSKDEGLAVLKYIKKHSPWTAVIILSGSNFPVSKNNDLSKADLCVTKASLNLAELVNLTEIQLTKILSPEYRNVKICNLINDQIDDLSLGWFKKYRLQRIINSIQKHEGDASFDWSQQVKKIQTILSTASNISSILALLIP